MAAPTRAAVKRMFNAMEAKLDRTEKRIDVLLERQASTGQTPNPSG